MTPGVRVVCLVAPAPSPPFKPNSLALTWSQGPDAFPAFAFDPQLVQAIARKAQAVHDRLGDLVTTYVDAVGEGEDGSDPDVGRAAFELARAGADLRQQLFRPGDDPGKAAARDVGRWLDGLHKKDGIESLEVVTETGPDVPAIPWGLLYDGQPDEAAFVAGGDDADPWRGFWGLRFNLAGGRRVDPRRRLPWWEAPSLLLVVDEGVRTGLAEHPDPKVREDFARLDELRKKRGLTFVESRAQLEAGLAKSRPDLLYWLGHTRGGSLQLGDDEIDPGVLRELLDGDGERPPGGLVFLNACRTAGAEPGASSFLDSVFGARMGGLIATEHVVLDTFANPLGVDFLEQFLDQGRPVGAVLRGLRGRVPLGLLYGTYCPPELRVVPPGPGPAAPAVRHVPVAMGVRLGDPDRPAPAWPPLPAHPYKSLQAYGPEDRALFAGRDDDVLRFAQVLDDPGTRLLILHGESGVGKTSFLRAGVVPYLEDVCIGYRFARDPAKAGFDALLFIRSTNDPVSQIARDLTLFCNQKYEYQTPDRHPQSADLPAVLAAAVGGRTGLDALREALRADPGLLGRVLADLAGRLPFILVLVLDQAEEMFTLAREPDDEANRVAALEMLRRAAGGPGGFKLVVSLRTEYHGRLVDRLRRGDPAAGGVREYLLTDFDAAALVKVIRRPTSTVPIPFASEVPAAKYGFRYADEVPETIAKGARARTTNRQDSALPLVQVICTQLYDLAHGRPDPTVTEDDLKAVGGLAGGMKRHAEGLVRRLFPAARDREAFQQLLTGDATQLFLRQADGTLTTALLPADLLRKHWAGRQPFDDMLAAAAGGDWRLLRVNTLRIGGDEAERPYVSLGHDALAPVAALWKAERARAAQVRKFAGVVVGLLALVGLLTGLTAWALKQRETAKTAQSTAETKTQEAEAERARALRQEYLATIRQADREWVHGNFGLAVDLLETYLPAARAADATLDYPGFEWRHQWRRAGRPLTLAGHTGSVEDVAWSPDGSRLATGSADGTVRIWDPTTGALELLSALHRDAVKWVAWSPAGTYLASGSYDQTVRVRNMRTGDSPILPFEPDSSPAGAWSPTGDRIALVTQLTKVKVWNPETATDPVTLAGHTQLVTSVSWSPDGARLATSSWDGTTRIWDAKTGAQNRVFDPQIPNVVDAQVGLVSWSPAGDVLVTAAQDGGFRVWDPDGKKRVVRLEGAGSPVVAIAWSRGGAYMAVAYANSSGINVWKAGQLPLTAFIRTGYQAVRGMAWSPDGSRLAAGSTDGVAAVFDPATSYPWLSRIVPIRDGLVKEAPTFGRMVGGIKAHSRPVTAVAWAPRGDRLATASADGTARVWDLTVPAPTVEPAEQAGPVRIAAVAPDGTRVATAAPDNTVRVWDPATGAGVAILTGHTAEVTAVGWSPAGDRLVTGSADGTARVWTAAGAPGPVLPGTRRITAAAWSPDPAVVAVASDDDVVRVWDPAAGRVRHTLKAGGGVVRLAWSPDGKRLAVALDDRPARVWTPAADTVVDLDPGEDPEPAESLAWSPDGKYLATGLRGRLVQVWDPATGRARFGWAGPAGPMRAAAWSPDGFRLAVAAADGTVQVLDLSGDEPKAGAALRGHAGSVAGVAWSPTGTRLASVADDGTARVWDPAAGKELLGFQPYGGVMGPLRDRIHVVKGLGIVWTPDGGRLIAAWDAGCHVYDGRP